MIAINVKKSLALSVVAMLAAVVVVSGQDDFQVLPAQQQAQLQNSFTRFKSMFQFDPMVNTGASELGGQKVHVHVPGGLFNLKLDSRSNNQGLRIRQTVLGGLVDIYMDRTRDPETQRLTGPISVKVAGLSIYQNQEARAMGGLPSAV